MSYDRYRCPKCENIAPEHEYIMRQQFFGDALSPTEYLVICPSCDRSCSLDDLEDGDEND